MAKILWAGLSWSQMGKHSGLAPLLGQIGRNDTCLVKMEVALNGPGFLPWVEIWTNRVFRACGLTSQLPEWVRIHQRGIPFYSERSWFCERNVLKEVKRELLDWVVMTSVEDQLFLLASEKHRLRGARLAAFSHQPRSWWLEHHGCPEVVEAVDLLVTLSTDAERFWASRLGSGRVVFIPHGVDIDFFTPGVPLPMQSDRPLRVVFGGRWLRDYETLCQVIMAVDEAGLPIQFDLIVPASTRNSPVFSRVSRSSRVGWHADIGDEALRGLYQSADILLLTLIDCTVNNTLLEGMACGLPVVVTDVGGARDYTDHTFADYVKPESPNEIVSLLSSYVGRRDLLATRGAAARAYAESHLAWQKLSRRFLEQLEGHKASNR